MTCIILFNPYNTYYVRYLLVFTSIEETDSEINSPKQVEKLEFKSNSSLHMDSVTAEN